MTKPHSQLPTSLEAGKGRPPGAQEASFAEKSSRASGSQHLPRRELSLCGASGSFSFLPSTSSLTRNKDIRANPQEHANWQTTEAPVAPRGPKACWALPGEEEK